MPQCGMGASGSSAAACRNERSASVAQKECICATPWMKNSRALGFEVVIGKRMYSLPWPDSIFAGNDGGTLPGGGEQRSVVLDCANAAPVSAALASKTQSLAVRIMTSLQLPGNEVAQL